MTVGIMGAGAWGRALGKVVASSGHSILFWDKDDKPPLDACTHIIISVPAQAVRSVLTETSFQKNQGLILASKGIEDETGLLMHEVVAERYPPAPVGILSGPNFATEIMEQRPGVAVLACAQRHWTHMAPLFQGPWFNVFHSEDHVGVQLAASLKNVIAIGIGMAQNLGENACAALLAQGLEETIALGVAMGAAPATFSGPAGVGDLALTAMGTRSRNLRFGEIFARGGTTMPDITVEGFHTAKSVQALLARYKITAPFLRAIYTILYEGQAPSTLVDVLLRR